MHMMLMKRKNRNPEYSIYDIEVENKDQILRESRDAIQKYIRYGIRNETLKRIIEQESEFQEEYSRCLDINNMLTEIKKIEKTQSLISTLENDSNTKKENASKIVAQFVQDTVDTVSKTVNKMFENLAYFSNMNMLYELYEKEKQLRREEEEFLRQAEQEKKLYEITLQLSLHRRMELKEVERKINIPKNELEKTINKSAVYFNIKERGEKTQISLTPKGMKFTEFMSEESRQFSRSAINQMRYNDCCMIFNMIEKTNKEKQKVGIRKKANIKFELEGLAPERNRALGQKFIKTIDSLFEDDNIKYEISKDGYRKCYSIEEDKIDDKNQFTISRRWDETFF